MCVVSIDTSKAVGKIKPMHCVNNFPSMCNSFDESFAALKIPYSRCHDTYHLESHLVDIHVIFPNFDADENDPNSYDFAFTDFWIKRLYDMGVKTFYRLGESIENFQALKPYYILPPKDFAKWARICEHIILHYNHGWANGFEFGLDYWEIWNEPDNYADIADNQMWKGTFEQFIDLYEISAKHLKSKFPEIKIGGYASCGFYDIFAIKSPGQAKVTTRTGYFIDCAEKFLQRAKDNKIPLDFFSWHSYSNVEGNIGFARYARRLLDSYGFTNTESHLNEWNPGIDLRGTLHDSSNILANMLVLQNEPVDMLMYYDARLHTTYNGIYNPITYKPFKSYYVFMAFSQLYQIGTQVESSVSGENIYSVTAFDGKNGVCVITNNSEEEKCVKIEGIVAKQVSTLTENNDLTPIDVVNEITLKAFESAVIKF